MPKICPSLTSTSLPLDTTAGQPAYAKYLRDCRSSNTRRAYSSDLKAFATWCSERDSSSMPASPETVVAYLAHLADSGRAASTIERSLASISQAHMLAGFESPRRSPIVRRVLSGIRRSLGTAQAKKAPILVDDLKRMIGFIPDDLRGKRDRAVLLLGFAAALRRSEIVSVDVDDLRFQPEGLEVRVRRSKGDQERCGQVVSIPTGTSPDTCPIQALRSWLDAASLSEGPLFRGIDRHARIAQNRLGAKSVASVLKSRAAAAGLDATCLAGHSLRSGFATTAIRAGHPEDAVMRHTRHKSIQVFRGYVRRADPFEDNPASGIGL